jgi:hypothetical protein
MKHGDIKTMKGDSLESIFGKVKVSFIAAKYSNPTNDSKMMEIAQYPHRIVNGEGVSLKSVESIVSKKQFAERDGTVNMKIMKDILFTVGIIENIEYWAKQLDLMNRSEYCEHSDDFEDPFSEFDMSQD